METKEVSILPATGFGERQRQPDNEHHTRPRPRSRLTSYFNPHRVITMQEKPEFDWSSLKEKDDVYVPDPGHMCNTLLQWYLANPGKDLPAGYSSFVLHVLEEYRRVTLMNEELRTQFSGDSTKFERTPANSVGPPSSKYVGSINDTSVQVLHEQSQSQDDWPGSGLRQGKLLAIAWYCPSSPP